MKRFWIEHCKTPQAKEEFKERLAYTQDMFLILKARLEESLETTCKARRSVGSTEMHNYSEFQADCNARERTLLEVIDLLPILEK